MIYGYLRVSSDGQDVNNQKLGVDSFAQAKNFHIDEYIFIQNSINIKLRGQ